MWLGLGLYFALVAIRVVLNYRSLRNYLRIPPILPSEEAPDTWPAVSVIIPTDGDIVELSALLRGLQALSVAPLEVIVAGSASNAAARAAEQKFGARLIDVEGTAGSTDHACRAYLEAAAAAQGEWLLFTQAECQHQPNSLQRALTVALRDGLQALSLLPQQHCRGFLAGLLLPYAAQQCFAGLPQRQINEPGERQAWLTPQYLLIRKSVFLEAAEGSGAPKTFGRLAERMKRDGVPVRLMRGEYQVSAAYGPDLRRPAQALPPIARFGPASRLWMWISVALSALAIPCAIYGLATHQLSFELAALLTYLTGAVELLTWQFLFRAPIFYGLLEPLALALFPAFWRRQSRSL